MSSRCSLVDLGELEPELGSLDEARRIARAREPRLEQIDRGRATGCAARNRRSSSATASRYVCSRIGVSPLSMTMTTSRQPRSRAARSPRPFSSRRARLTSASRRMSSSVRADDVVVDREQLVPLLVRAPSMSSSRRDEVARSRLLDRHPARAVDRRARGDTRCTPRRRCRAGGRRSTPAAIATSRTSSESPVSSSRYAWYVSATNSQFSTMPPSRCSCSRTPASPGASRNSRAYHLHRVLEVLELLLVEPRDEPRQAHALVRARVALSSLTS